VRSNDDQLAPLSVPRQIHYEIFVNSARKRKGSIRTCRDSFEAFEDRRLTRACPSGAAGTAWFG